MTHTIEQILSPHGPAEAVARFAKSVQVNERGCWLWTGVLTTNGYGRFKLKGKIYRAHRLAYLWVHGRVPDVLDHIECDTPRCANPAHVQPSTTKENVLRGKGPTAINSRKTHCDGGHLLPKPGARGTRTCQICANRPINPETPEQRRERCRKAAKRSGEIRAAKTHCLHGHPFSPENTLLLKGKSRMCLACKRQADKHRNDKIGELRRLRRLTGYRFVVAPLRETQTIEYKVPKEEIG